MSFSFEYLADSKEIAKAHIPTSTPDSVKEFVETAIDNIKLNTREGWRQIISVKAMGHLCDGPASYDRSTASIEVYQLLVKTA